MQWRRQIHVDIHMREIYFNSKTKLKEDIFVGTQTQETFKEESSL